MVRNGNRWRVAAIDEENYRIAAVRLDDGAGAVFSGDYLREHINLGYAVTVHSAQGVTADTSRAVLGENTTRELLYVAMTRGRHTNSAHFYERGVDDNQSARGHSPLLRGDSGEAAQFARAVIARHSLPQTAHDVASHRGTGVVPDRVARLLQHRADSVESRRQSFRAWESQRQTSAQERIAGLNRDVSQGLDL